MIEKMKAAPHTNRGVENTSKYPFLFILCLRLNKCEHKKTAVSPLQR